MSTLCKGSLHPPCTQKYHSQPSCQWKPPSSDTVLSMNLPVAGPTKSQKGHTVGPSALPGSPRPRDSVARSLLSHWSLLCSPKPIHSQLYLLSPTLTFQLFPSETRDYPFPWASTLTPPTVSSGFPACSDPSRASLLSLSSALCLLLSLATELGCWVGAAKLRSLHIQGWKEASSGDFPVTLCVYLTRRRDMSWKLGGFFQPTRTCHGHGSSSESKTIPRTPSTDEEMGQAGCGIPMRPRTSYHRGKKRFNG